MMAMGRPLARKSKSESQASTASNECSMTFKLSNLPCSVTTAMSCFLSAQSMPIKKAKLDMSNPLRYSKGAKKGRAPRSSGNLIESLQSNF